MHHETLPQLDGGLFLTDGGIETTLIFHEGFELPDFAAFHLLRNEDGERALRRYFATYLALAREFGTGLILESPTWRASNDWGSRLGYSPDAISEVNRQAVQLLEDLRQSHDSTAAPVVVSGCVGPRGDGYVPGRQMSTGEAEHYHQQQVDALADAGADMICALTMNYAEEAVGIARAAHRAEIPVAVSFTLETDGRLPTGQDLGEAIEEVDAATDDYPAYYMINCAHPTHFSGVLEHPGKWVQRIRGIRANASRMSHAELDEAQELDAGNPEELARQYADLKRRIPHLNVLGGCCGTDDRHVRHIASACLPLFGQPA